MERKSFHKTHLQLLAETGPLGSLELAAKGLNSERVGLVELLEAISAKDSPMQTTFKSLM